MQTLEALRRRIDSANDMQSVVAAMKVLAVVSIRQFERSLESLSRYQRTIELGLQAVLQNRPRQIRLSTREPASRSRCALVFGSEQGLSGQFNEQIASFTSSSLERQGGASPNVIVAMGEHVVHRLAGAGLPPDATFPIPGSVSAVSHVTHDVLLYVNTLRQQGRADELVLFFHKPLTGASYRPFRLLLFPLDPAYLRELEQREWQSRSRPVFTQEWRQLFAALVRQHLLATLETAFAQSLLSENASRLFSMQVAEKNITDYLEELGREFNNQRQGEITAELLDIVAGSEALYAGEEEYPLMS